MLEQPHIAAFLGYVSLSRGNLLQLTNRIPIIPVQESR